MERGAMRHASRRWQRAGTTAVVAILVFVLIDGAQSGIPIEDADVTASATGTVLHADLLQTGGMKLVDTEVAFSGAAFDSTGLTKPALNEMERPFAPITVGKLGYGRGVGVEIGLVTTPKDVNELVLAGLAESSSPIGVVTKEVGPVDVDPLGWVNLLRGQAMTAAAKDECLIGRDLSNGAAYVADLQLLDMESGASSASGRRASSTSRPATPVERVAKAVAPVTAPVDGLIPSVSGSPSAPASRQEDTSRAPTTQSSASTAAPNEGLDAPVVALDADGPKRAVSQSRSRTLLVGQRAKNGTRLGRDFGVMSEVRQTSAPITLFKNTPNEITIELLGEWVLQAVATGMPGGAYVHYGPAAASPSTPVVRLIDANGASDVLRLQDVFGNDGLVVEVPGLAEIAIGEDLRAVGGGADSAPAVANDGTSAAAAVDIVRVKLLPGAPAQLADVRVGHMEVRTQVPQGGVSCSIPVTKEPSKKTVAVGDGFDVDFTVTNPYDCTISNVRVTDEISTEDAARFAIVETKPATTFPSGSPLDAGKITWEIGDLAPHATKTVSARFRALVGEGVISDKAVASGTLTDCADPGASVGGVSVAAVDAFVGGLTPAVEVSVDDGTAVAASGGERVVPLTGAPIALLAAIGMALLALGGAAITLAYRLR